MIQRDLTKEQRAVGVFQGSAGRLPDLNDPKERAQVYKMAYPTGLPQELAGTVDESLGAAGITKPVNTTPEGLRMQAGELGGQKEQALQRFQGFSQPNEAMRILQDAIRTKTQAADTKLGESKIFEQAGLGGSMNTLAQSLSTRQKEIDINMTDFKNIIGEMGGNFRDMANSALNEYNLVATEYSNTINRLQQLEDQERQKSEKIELMKLQADLSKDTGFKFVSGTENQPSGIFDPSTGEFTSIKDMERIKFDPITGAPTDPTKVIGGYNFTSYATDENWGNAINNILQGIKVETVEDVQRYIELRNPNANFTGQDLVDVSTEYGIPPALFMAMMQHESGFGNSNVAKNNNNYGGITWNTNFPEAMKGTPRPADEGGNYVKYNTPADGLRAIAKNIARRDISGSLEEEVKEPSAFASMVVNNPSLMDSLTATERGEVLKEIAEAGGMFQTQGQESALRMVNSALETAKKLEEMMTFTGGFRQAVGFKGPESFFGLKSTPIAGTDAATFTEYLKTLKSQITIPNLQFLAGLGRMTSEQYRTLQEASETLSTNMNEKAFKEEFKEVVAAMQEYINENEKSGGTSISDIKNDDYNAYKIIIGEVSNSTPQQK